MSEETTDPELESSGTKKPPAFQGFEDGRGPSKTNETERAGFEPAVGFYPHAALAKRCRDAQNAENSSVSDVSAGSLAPLLALLVTNADLLQVARAWPTLSANIRSAILALIGSQQ